MIGYQDTDCRFLKLLRHPIPNGIRTSCLFFWFLWTIQLDPGCGAVSLLPIGSLPTTPWTSAFRCASPASFTGGFPRNISSRCSANISGTLLGVVTSIPWSRPLPLTSSGNGSYRVHHLVGRVHRLINRAYYLPWPCTPLRKLDGSDGKLR